MVISDFNANTKIMSEQFFFTFPGKRGAGKGMIDRFEEEATKRGVKRIYMGHFCVDDRPSRLYKLLGYEPELVVYRKDFANA